MEITSVEAIELRLPETELPLKGFFLLYQLWETKFYMRVLWKPPQL